MKKIYEVCGFDEYEVFQSEEELCAKYEMTKRCGNWMHEDLVGTPVLNGLIGPMWNGNKDGIIKVRYESQKLYDLLSR